MKKNLLVSIIILLTILVINYLTKPTYLNYQESIKAVEVVNDQIEVVFNEQISNYKVNKSIIDNHQVYTIEAYTQKINFNNQQNLVIDNLSNNDVVVFSNFDKTLDTVIYGKDLNMITLPRLVLNYYSLLAIISIILFSIMYVLIKQSRKIVKSLLVISISYLLATHLNLGLNFTSLNVGRDFMYNLLISITLINFYVQFNKNKKHHGN